MNRCEILALTNSLSILLSEGLDNDDLNMLGNLLSAVGSVIATFGSIDTHESPQNNPKS